MYNMTYNGLYMKHNIHTSSSKQFLHSYFLYIVSNSNNYIKIYKFFEHNWVIIIIIIINYTILSLNFVQNNIQNL